MPLGFAMLIALGSAGRSRRPGLASPRLLSALAPAALVLGAFWSYGDLHNPAEQVHAVGVPKLQGLRTTAARAAYVESIYRRYRDAARSHELVVLGEPSNLFYYLFDTVPIHPHLFMNPVQDEGFVRTIGTALHAASKPPLVLYLPDGQFDPSWPSNLVSGAWKDAEYRQLATRLGRAGLVAAERTDHAVFRTDAAR